MDTYDEMLTVINPLPIWFLFILLILFGGIIWGFEKKVGFQLLYLSILSMCIAYLLNLYFPITDFPQEEVLPLTLPLIQTVATLFFYYIPTINHKIHAFLVLLFPIFFSICYQIIFSSPFIPMFNSFLIAGFIIYTFYRSLDWLGGMPEPYLFSLAFIMPLFFALLVYPMEEALLYAGILLGTGLGFLLELLKVRLSYISIHTSKRALSLLIGISGMVVIYFIKDLFIAWIPFGMFFLGGLIGFWICFIVPFLLVNLRIYHTQSRTNLHL